MNNQLLYQQERPSKVYTLIIIFNSLVTRPRSIDQLILISFLLLVNTGLFINNEFIDSIDGKRFETINPTTEKVISTVAEASANDVDKAVDIATEAYVKVWSKISGYDRGRLINKLADLMERDIDELAALESLDNGKPFALVKAVDIAMSIKTYRYFAGFADKINGTVNKLYIMIIIMIFFFFFY
jgi:acyl-CoA reductase-like NAD-dependent aldehyde dehydrogenase